MVSFFGQDPQARRRQRLVVFLAVAAVSFWGLIPYFPPLRPLPPRGTSYTSSGVLFVAASARRDFYQRFGVRGRSPVDFWLSSQELMNTLAEQRDLYTRALGRLAHRPAGFSAPALAGSVQIAPVTFQGGGRELIARAPGTRAPFIRITARAESPSAARERAEAVMAAFRSTLQDLAGEDCVRQRQSLSLAMASVQRKMRVTSKRLGQLSSPHQEEAQLQQDLQRARSEMAAAATRRDELLAELAGARSQELSGDGEAAGKLATVEGDLLRERLLLERIYQPDSQVMQSFLRREKRAAQTRMQLQEQARQSHAQALSVQIRACQARLESAGRDFRLLEAELADQALLRDRAVLQRDYALWDEELSRLESQLFWVRLEEKLARSDAATTVLTSPPPGLLVETVENVRAPRYRNLFALFPLATFAGLAAVSVLELHWARNCKSERVARLLDVPVVALLPELSGSKQRAWQTLKRGKVAGTAKPSS